MLLSALPEGVPSDGVHLLRRDGVTSVLIAPGATVTAADVLRAVRSEAFADALKV